VPKNDKALDSPLYVDPETLMQASTSEPKPLPKITARIRDIGFGTYDISESCCVGRMPLSPKSYGKPPITKVTKKVAIPPQGFLTQFQHGWLMEEETIEDISSWLYKEKEPVTIPVKQYGNGLRIVKNMDYKGKGGLGKQNQGTMEPIVVTTKLDKKGLGFGKKVPHTLDIEYILDEVANAFPADSMSTEDIINDSSLHMTNLFAEFSIFMLSFVSLTSTTSTQNVTLVYPKLIDRDQQGSPVIDVFQNDEDLAEFMGLREGIPLGDHKVGFVMELEPTAYFGENAKG